MADTFVEVLIARKVPGYANPLKAALGGAAAVAFFFGIINWIFFIVFLVALMLLIFVVPNKLYIEYEYTYIGDQMNVDKIMNKAKRKKCGEYTFDHIELVAMKNSADIQRLLQNPAAKTEVVDYTSHFEDRKVYAMVYMDQAGKKIILFEPNEKLLNAMKYTSPRKVLPEC